MFSKDDDSHKQQDSIPKSDLQPLFRLTYFLSS